MSSYIQPDAGFESIVTNSNDALVGADLQGRIVLFNPAAEQMFGLSSDEVMGQGLECLMPLKYRQGHGGHMAGYFSRGQESDLIGKTRQMIGMHVDGHEFPIELSLAQGMSKDKPFVLAFVRDISERESAKQALQESQKRYERAVSGSREGIWDWNLRTNKVYYASRWKGLLGISQSDFDDSPDAWFSRIVSSSLASFHDKLSSHIEGKTDTLDVELEMRHADGSIRWMLCRAIASRDPQGVATSIAGSMADITELKQTQEKLKRIAEHDRLTALPNRSVLTARLNRCIKRASEDRGYRFALLFFDFDRFKIVNDGLGHNVGDALLVSIAQRLGAQLRENDMVSRFGGDEFVMLYDGVEGLEEVEGLCSALVDEMAKPHDINGYEIVSTASIGVATSDHAYQTPDEMIRDADTAMYHAKASGKNTYRLFDKIMHARALEQIDLERDLRRNPFEAEFDLVYQPIVSLETGWVAGFEALIRWHHPDRGTLSPDQFIGIAEETGLIIPMGEFVIRRACQQAAEWRRRLWADKPLYINVNISKRQLAHPDLVPMLKESIEQSGAKPQDLVLEVTETAIMDSRQNMVPTMNQIRDMGLRLAMDDFGTGQSSLSCLHQFPIDVLKIDRSFIVNMEYHRQFAAVVQSIILLAQHMDMQIIAEGIENWSQLAQLQSMDCTLAQGYLFSKPLPADEAGEYLAKRIEIPAAG